MPTLLFPGGVRCSVSAGAHLAFPPRAAAEEAYLPFEVEGVVFELRRSILDETPAFADSFFGRAAAFPGELLRLRRHSAELYPLVLDFMVRRHADPAACLRVGALTLAQTHALDVLEDYLFPGMVPDRVFADPARTRVLVALLPGYRHTFFGAFALSERGRGDSSSGSGSMNEDAFLYHEGLEALCVDARFVRLVQAGRVGDAEEAVRRQLEAEYALRKPITNALVDACELIAVDRGVPFRIESRRCGGDQYLSVVDELQPCHVA
jgi:hypothetical protein